MHAAVSGKDRAKTLAPFGPVHGLALKGFRDGLWRVKLITGSSGSKGEVISAAMEGEMANRSAAASRLIDRRTVLQVARRSPRLTDIDAQRACRRAAARGHRRPGP